MHFKSGTVGRLLDRIEHRLDPVEGIAEGGRLVVKGPNVMLGYLRADTPGVIEPPPDGWYDTGDIVTIDLMGFVTIHGRAKRFAKIAGEMVSLALVESKIHSAFPDVPAAVVSLRRTPRRANSLSSSPPMRPLDRNAVSQKLKAAGIGELMIPRTIIVLEDMPVLGSGKIDYVTLNRLAREKVAP